MARFGYLSKGLVYAAVGALALQAAFGQRAAPESSRGTLVEIASRPLGSIILPVVLAGLCAYALWRLVQSWSGIAENGGDPAGLARRAGYAASGLIYLGLAAWGTLFLVGTVPSGGGDASEEWTARLMRLPLGRWLVALAAGIIAFVGLYQLRSVVRASFMNAYRHGEMGRGARTLALWAGRIGITARALTFLMIAGFVAYAAWTFDPSEARGLRGALRSLEGQEHGGFLLGAVGIGFLAYGVYCFTRAKYRDFERAVND
jgi:hypothetical protein